jgi:hypothetical protein
MKGKEEPIKINFRKRTKVPNVCDETPDQQKPENTALSLLALI